MSKALSNTLDCKIQVRRYVLVANPSRWNQKGRVIVHSPVLEISKSMLLIPVRRYHGEEENSVCLLPMEDIEKDSSIAFKHSQVEITTLTADAHGVALVDSSPADSFKYRRSDKFWISIGSDFAEHKTTVPVINLRTSESGIISIAQVCWYPKIQGPGSELWTPGGVLRSRKLEGSKRFAYYSYVVRQPTPGTWTSDKDSTPIAESVMIYSPVRGSIVKDTRHLPSWESQGLFNQRLRFMESSLRTQSPSTSPAETKLLPTCLLNPPSSPELDYLRRRLGEAGIFGLNVSYGERESSVQRELWSRVLDMMSAQGRQRDNRGDAVGHKRRYLRHSPVIPSDVSRNPRPSNFTSDENGEIRFSDDRVTAGKSTCTQSPAPQFFISNAGNLDASPVGIEILLEIFKDTTIRPAVSVTSLDIYQNPILIREAWERKRMELKSVPRDLCDQGNDNCPYNFLFRCRHFHPLPANCLLKNITACPADAQSTKPETDNPAHGHCISRLAPYPAGAGDCILSNIPSISHICCTWAAADLENKSTLHKRSYQALNEQSRKRLRTHDRRSLIDARLEMEQCVGLRESYGFDEEGTELLQEDFETGVLLGVTMELVSRCERATGEEEKRKNSFGVGFEDLLCESLISG